MPGGRTKFKSKWLEIKDGNGDLIGNWCSATKNEFEAYCMICKTTLSVANSGIAQLQQHALRQKHVASSKELKGQKTLSGSSPFLTMNAQSKPPTLAVALTTEQLVTKAEAVWAMKVVESNYSFKSCQNISDVFKIMFNNHPVIDSMQLSDRKLSYLISHGLSPFFLDQLLCDLKASLAAGNFFSLSFDETTTLQGKKQMDVHVRFWSEKRGCIFPAYLTSIFLGHADAKTMCDALLKVFEDHKIPMKKLFMISMDGPRVNLLLAKKVNAVLDEQGCPGLVDIDTCTLHKVHNSFAKSLENLPLDIDEFASDLFGFFKHSAARREDLLGIEKLLDCEEKFLLRHVSSRWLTLGPVISRILDILPALEEYFLKFLPKQNGFGNLQNNGRYKRIISALKNKETVVYLRFVSHLFPVLQAYLEIFQGKSPLIHILHEKMIELLKNILVKFMVERSVTLLTDKQLLQLNLEDIKSFRKLKDLEVGIATDKALSVLSETEEKRARMEIRSCLVSLAKNVRNKLPFSNKILRDLRCLDPRRRNEDCTNALKRLCISLSPLRLEDQEIDLIVLEWRTYRFDPEVQKIFDEWKTGNTPIDQFWKKVFITEDQVSKKLKYPNLQKIVKSCLTLYHGNSDVERGFSINNNILNDSRTSLNETTIIGIRRVKDAIIIQGGIDKIDIIPKMLKYVGNSHSAYASEKEKEKQMKEQEQQKKRQAEEEAIRNDALKKQKIESKEKVKKLHEEIKELNEEMAAANKCIEEGTASLKVAMKEKNNQKMRVASNLIDAGTTKIKMLNLQLLQKQQQLIKFMIL